MKSAISAICMAGVATALNTDRFEYTQDQLEQMLARSEALEAQEIGTVPCQFTYGVSFYSFSLMQDTYVSSSSGKDMYFSLCP
jgi:hypothetical protein